MNLHLVKYSKKNILGRFPKVDVNFILDTEVPENYKSGNWGKRTSMVRENNERPVDLKV